MKTRPPENDGIRTCRVCGCTEDDCARCVEVTFSACHWVEWDLCSACVPLTANELEELRAKAAMHDGGNMLYIPARTILRLIDTAEQVNTAEAEDLRWEAVLPGPEGLEPYEPFEIVGKGWAFVTPSGTTHAGFPEKALAIGCADKIRTSVAILEAV